MLRVKLLSILAGSWKMQIVEPVNTKVVAEIQLRQIPSSAQTVHP